MYPTDLTSLLVFLAGGAAAGLLSPFLESIAEFKALPAQTKVVIVVFLNTVLAVIALAVVQLVPKETITLFNPYFSVALNAIYIGINQLAYLFSKPTANN